MKRIILLLATLMMGAGTVFADNDKPITVDQLPATAKQLIREYFPETKVSYAKMETDIFEKSYEVVFTNGDKVEFDSDGAWENVDCKFTQVPEGMVPQQLKNYVIENYKDMKIVEMERDKRGYEIKLNNGLGLGFNSKFELIEIDD